MFPNKTISVEPWSPKGDDSEGRQAVMQVTMNRPDVFNAFHETMVVEVDQAFSQLAALPEVRVIILAGAGKHFSAGADLQWMQKASRASFDWNLEDARRFAGMFSRIHRFPKPVIARVQGAAMGGGAGLVCACDFAIGSENARFAISEARFGIIPSVIGPYLVNAVGPRAARRLALTTTKIGAEEALRLGLLQQLVSAEELDAAIDSVVRDLLDGGPQAHKEIKQLFSRLSIGPVADETIELTAQTISRLRGTEEAREGFEAFLTKRPASWVPKD